MRVVLVNTHWNNRGDEAALYALIECIYKVDPQIRIGVIFKETKTVVQFFYNEKVDYIITRFRPDEEEVKSVITFPESCNNVDMKKEMDFLDSADIVIYAPGGSVISDRFWWTKQLEYLFPIVYAQSRGMKTFFAAPSVGPFKKEHIYRNDIFCKIDRICLRENISVLELMSSVGGAESVKCILGNDLAFLSTVDMEENNKIFQTDTELLEKVKRYGKIVGITITDLNWNVEYEKDAELRQNIEDSFNNFICWLEKKEIGVILIPQLFGEQNDINYLLRYQELHSNVSVLDEKYDSQFQQYFISKCYAIVGLRYHSNIFAAKMGTPMIPVIYEQKMRGFCIDSGIYEWAIEIQELSFKVLVNRFKELEKEYVHRKMILHNKQIEWKTRAERTIKTLIEVIKTVGET